MFRSMASHMGGVVDTQVEGEAGSVKVVAGSVEVAAGSVEVEATPVEVVAGLVEEEEEIQLVTDKVAENLRKECATGTFRKSGDKIPKGILEKKNKLLVKWKKDQEAKGNVLKKGKWSKQLASIDETTKDVKKDTTEIKATTKDIQTKTDKLLAEQEALPQKLAEVMDKKNNAIYAKPKDMVEMGVFLGSSQVQVKLLHAILDDSIPDEDEKQDLKRKPRQFKAAYIAQNIKIDKLQELLKKHTSGTEPPPAKKQRRSELCEVCNEHVPDVGDICQNCRPSSAGASGSCAGNASIALGEGTESKETKAKGMGKGKGQGKGKGEAEKQTSKGGMGGRGGGKGKAKGKGKGKGEADVDSVVEPS